MTTTTLERPTELADAPEYRQARETLERVQREQAETELELRDVDQRLKSRSLAVEADAVLAGGYDLSENGNLRSRYNDLVALRAAQTAAIEKQQMTVNQAKTRASVLVCKGHQDEYRDLIEQTRDAAEELVRLTQSRMDLHADFKSRGIGWYLPSIRHLELPTRLPELVTDCSDALTELSKDTD